MFQFTGNFKTIYLEIIEEEEKFRRELGILSQNFIPVISRFRVLNSKSLTLILFSISETKSEDTNTKTEASQPTILWQCNL
jgi:hypothetical protein